MTRMYVPVSVIVPCYCCHATIGMALDSVANQTMLPREVILVEDGSPDDGATFTYLAAEKEKYMDHFSIQILNLGKNRGVGTARNMGWDVATQPYIAFLDADDTWHPEKLAYQYRYMKENPAVSLSGHGCSLRRRGASYSWDFNTTIYAKRITPCRLLLSNQFVTPSVMIKSDVPFRFLDGQRHMEDHLLWLEMVLTGCLVVKLDAKLVFLYKPGYGASGLSSHLWEMEKSDLGNYCFLYKKKYIGLLAIMFFLPLSLLKYMRRLLVVGARKYALIGKNREL